jgi:hypothetical protein
MAILSPEQIAASGSEHAHQSALFQWIAIAPEGAKRRPELNLLFAIPNGGDRRPSVGAKMRAEGVKPGVPDLFLPVCRDGRAGLFIEMKAGNNAPSEKQKIWHLALMLQGYRVVVAYSWEEARDLLLEYLEQPKERGG